MPGPAPKYAVAERERRFLLAGAPVDLPPGRSIEDRYVPGTGLRLRSVTDPDGTVLRKLNHKVRDDGDGNEDGGGPGTVWCTSIYPDDAEWSRLTSLGGALLQKRRHLLSLDDQPVAVDVFGGALSGLVLAEVDRGERPDVEDLPDRLRALGLDVVREVSEEEGFTGGALAVGGAPAPGRAGGAGVTVRPFADGDWPAFERVFAEVVEAGETYVIEAGEDPRSFWVGAHVVVAEDADGTLLGSAKMGPNRPAQGAHVGTASFMVGSAARGLGVGRALGDHVVRWHREQGISAIQFNAVVETNTTAVRLWQSLGFTVVGVVPGAFRRPSGEHVGLLVMHLDLTGPPPA